jgi:hypothetical protein
MGDVCPEDVADEWTVLAQAMRATETRLFTQEAPEGCANCEGIPEAETKGDLVRMVNTANVTAEVDYEHVYYLNTLSPWNGTSSVDTHLNADGTLGEGSASVDNETWSTILNAIGSLAGDATTFGSAKVAAAATVKAAQVAAQAAPTNKFEFNVTTPSKQHCDDMPGWPMPGPPPDTILGSQQEKDAKKTVQVPANQLVTYKVTLSSEIYLHDHVKKDLCIGADPKCQTACNGKEKECLDRACKPDPAGVTDGSVTITKIDDSKGGDDSNAIKVSGQVVLPKPPDTDKKDK